MKNTLKTFDLRPGRILARKYEVISLLGSGWEGEVYKIRELDTDIERAAKLFFPARNLKNKTINANAKMLHKLKNCSMVIHYHTREVIQFQKKPVVLLISEFVEGDLLIDYLAKQRGKRLELYKRYICCISCVLVCKKFMNLVIIMVIYMLATLLCRV